MYTHTKTLRRLPFLPWMDHHGEMRRAWKRAEILTSLNPVRHADIWSHSREYYTNP